MLQVELDIFSGRPNPSWILSDKEEKELLDRVAADPNLMLPASATNGRLGYRGYVVTAVSESLDKKLPSRFRIGGQPGSEGDVNLWLLGTSEKLDTEVDDYLREIATGMIRKDEVAPGLSDALPDKGALAACASNFLTSSSDFSFWNGAANVTVNNCYNYASNYRSNTFAQPGRQSGHLSSFPPTCSKIGTAIRWDGWKDVCQASSNLTICLVIWPSTSPSTGDFHFYRKCSGGLWCHKPGQTPAKNTDDGGNLITNPQTANRGLYTTFCEYFYVGGGSIVVS
ncbi:MAG TPA: hypothetical protein VKK31_12615 [Thermoanaerobaculia bacterium]|nr:hypothetical protein [Thermoanaerobaculia bacterium]